MKRLIHDLFLLLWLQLHLLSQGEKVEQSPSVLSVQEGDGCVINCTYTDSTFSYFPWYKQEPGQGPQLIIDIRSNRDRNENGKLLVLLKKNDKHLSLLIKDTQPGDSAVYYCAASGGTGNNKLIFGTGTLLSVKPNIRNPEPSVYQMKDPKFRNTSICLFTDFDSQINVTQGSEAMDSEVFYSGKTVLDMRSIDFKSNGAVAWSKKTDFECTGVFQEKVSLPSSDHSCNAKLVEKSFETDMNLNFQNLIVIGLRILLLKVAGYNVFMTLRLWSS